MRRVSIMCLGLMLMTGSGRAQDESGFKPIFDGKSLAGWSGEEGYWRVEEGAIVGESTAEKPLNHNTFLLWDQGEVDDFELRLQFRISGTPAANSGIQFRSRLREDGHVIGYQADIDRGGSWVGALYDEALRGVLARRGQKTVVSENGEKKTEQVADADELFKSVDIDGWNDYSITARGNRIVLKINDKVTAEVIDNDKTGLGRIGVLALQLHSGPAMKIEFKNIRLKRFPLEEGWKKVVFFAGTRSHGYFSHEHNAGSLLLAKRLNAAHREHGLPVVATVYQNGWPSDPTALDNADTLVAYCDGGGRHFFNDRLEELDQLVQERGLGIVCIHYAVETTIGPPGEHFLKWIGGYFEPNWSVNPHWDANFKELPEHPITRGVKPFELRDEWYYHMRFQPDLKGVTPILTDMPPRETLNRPDGPHSGNPHVREAVLERKEPQHVAWAYERPDGQGRGFGFTGGHFHANWQNDDFRKVVLNAIVWSAGLDVPEEGVPSATPTQEEMEANQDFPKPGQAGPGGRGPGTEALAQSPQPSTLNPQPLFSSPVITSKTPGHAIDIDVDISGAKQLFLVVTDGGNGYACDWADWAEPRLVSAETETKLTELKWKNATSDWGSVQVNKNCEGKPLRINGQPVTYGIGTHANSVIEYELPERHKFTRFKVRGGLDNGGTDQQGGNATNVQFHVFAERPNRTFLAKMSGAPSSAETISHDAADAVAQLDVHPDLEVTLFASEPMFTNPASIDIDHLGRVWVCEAVNYRAFRNADVIGENPKPDRILVLEDTNGDGRADKSTVFYQGSDVDSAHGVLVLPTPEGKGLKALVSAGDAIFFLIDDDGDLQADRKEFLFTGIDGKQHDHGIHAVHFGPDGKLYFNFGNTGRRIKDKDGQPIIDKAGNEVNDSRQPYQQGMAFRCNMDGSEFETLGWNFRNNWEVCVDSFGTMWQSDNDDDGNQGVRINYVMEFGNYGYQDELTGAGWRTPRTGWEEDIPSRHWHQNDPGVIPNLLQTGAGSPTGITIYEGDLLPKMFQGAILHCDAGPNIFRAYVTKPDGAGYKAEIVDILDGARNKWFRPSDVCIAPDGSVFVADWYDAGVGGHRMQNPDRGRLFRVVPKEKGLANKYVAPKTDVSTVEGAIAALKSPNMSCRYLGWTALMAMGEKAERALVEMWKSDNPRFRARALWLLGKLALPHEKTVQHLSAALTDDEADIRIAGIRLLRQIRDRVTSGDIDGTVHPDDRSPAVRREILIALRDIDSAWLPVDAIPNAWTMLALQHDGQDRWYLEALGITADGRWDQCLPRWLEEVGQGWRTTKAGRDIIWRSRGSRTPELLAAILSDPKTPAEEIPRYLRALDFQRGEGRNELLVKLAFNTRTGDDARDAFVRSEALNRIQSFDVSDKPEYLAALTRSLENSRGSEQFVKLVGKFNVQDKYAELLTMAQQQPESQVAVEAVKTLIDRQQVDLIKTALSSDDRDTVDRTLTALGTAADGRANRLLLDLLKDNERPLSARRGAVKALGASLPGARTLLEMAKKEEYTPQLKESFAAVLNTAQWQEIREPGEKLFPPPPGKDTKPIPPISELVELKGDVAHGRVIFNTTGTCNKCHQVNGIGTEIGPDLSEIGKKLTKPALFESILYPSAAISHNYETWLVLTLEGQVHTGILVSETPTELKLKDEKGILRSIPVVSIEERLKQDVSLMPADIQKLLTVQELVDVVEYMTTLKERRQ